MNWRICIYNIRVCEHTTAQSEQMTAWLHKFVWHNFYSEHFSLGIHVFLLLRAIFVEFATYSGYNDREYYSHE